MVHGRWKRVGRPAAQLPERVRPAGLARAAQGGAGDSRSVMPSDAPGGTRNTILVRHAARSREGGTGACNGAANVEFPVAAAHQAAANTSL